MFSPVKQLIDAPLNAAYAQETLGLYAALQQLDWPKAQADILKGGDVQEFEGHPWSTFWP